MSIKAKIAIAVGFAILAVLIGIIFAKINALEIQNASDSFDSHTVLAQTQNFTKADENLITLDVSVINQWGTYGEFSANVGAKLTNNSSYTATDWKITLPINNDMRIENIWNGVSAKSNNTIIITSADYNKNIAPGQTIEVGFIVSSISPSVFDNYSAEATVNGNKTSFTQSDKAFVTDNSAPVSSQIVNNGVSAHGQLKVLGTQLVDKDNNPVVLKGMSSHGLVWYPQFTNEYTINKTKEYGANVYRAAMYTEEYGGYTTGEKFKNTSETLVYNAVDTAISLDMYAIIDWHILSDNTPQKHKAEAIAFFDKVSKKYANNPAVIYEICNEPNNTSWSNDIKPYANEVIPVIRKNSPNAVILVGTNTWSQDVDEASRDKLAFDNIMYTFHFYAGTHSLDSFKNKIETALSNGCAIFVSEWGTTKADGNNGVYLEESAKWLEYLKEKGISRINWSLSDKDESSAAFKPNTNCESFTYDDLTESGKFVFDSFTKY